MFRLLMNYLDESCRNKNIYLMSFKLMMCLFKNG